MSFDGFAADVQSRAQTIRRRFAFSAPIRLKHSCERGLRYNVATIGDPDGRNRAVRHGRHLYELVRRNSYELDGRTLSARFRNADWAQRRFNMDQHVEGFGVFASGASADIDAGALPIDSDARLLAANMHAGQCLDCTLSEGAMAYLVPTAGGIQMNDVRLAARDGAAVINESALSITAYGDTWVVLLETVLSAKAAVRVAAL